MSILDKKKANASDVEKEIMRIEDILSKMSTGQPVEIRAPTPKSNVSDDDIKKWNEAADRALQTEKDMKTLQKKT